MKRSSTLLFTLLLALSCISAAVADDTALPSGKICWLCNDYGESEAKLVEEYNQYNPNVQVDIEIYPRATLMEVIEVKLGAGDTSYDVLFVDQPLFASYSWKDYLLPLDDYFTEEQLSVFTDADLKAGYVGNELIALPFMSSSQVLIVKYDLLAEAGISLDEDYINLSKRITWEDFSDICVQFMETRGQQNNVYQLLALGNFLVVDAIAADGVTVEGVLNTEPWIKAMQYYQNTYIADSITPIGATDDELWDPDKRSSGMAVNVKSKIGFKRFLQNTGHMAVHKRHVMLISILRKIDHQLV